MSPGCDRRFYAEFGSRDPARSLHAAASSARPAINRGQRAAADYGSLAEQRLANSEQESIQMKKLMLFALKGRPTRACA